VRFDQDGGNSSTVPYTASISLTNEYRGAMGGEDKLTIRGSEVAARRERTQWGYAIKGDGDSKSDTAYALRVFPVFADAGRTRILANLIISEQGPDLRVRQTTVLAGSCALR
jgi:hypothetical protein